MARFLDPLDVRKTDDGRWITLNDLRYESDLLGQEITVPARFITDFASVPRIPLAWLLTGDTAHKPAVVHDYLYQHPNWEDRALADNIFFEAMETDGEPAWRRYIMWTAIRSFGWLAWMKHEKRSVTLNPKWSETKWPELQS